MSKRLISLLILLALVFPSALPRPTAQAATSTSPGSGRFSPIMFIENVGQWDAGARFQVRGADGTMWLAEDALWLTVVEQPADDAADSHADPLARFEPDLANAERENQPRKAANIKVSFVGANPRPRLETFDPLDTVVSYFIGNELDKWRPDVPVWGGVRYVDLYPGIDVEVTSEDGRLVQRLGVRRGADLSAVRLRVEGADNVAMDSDILRLTTAAGDVAFPLLRVDGASTPGPEAPEVQPHGSQAFDVAAPFAPANSAPAASEASGPQATVDNPADMLYGTFLGGSGQDGGNGIAVDAAGAAYVTGLTRSADFPTTPGAFDTSFNDSNYMDAFVVKLNPAGSSLAYATFLGGSSTDHGFGIAVDAAGSAYVMGVTYGDFPTTPGAFDTSFNDYNYWDAFVVKLNPAGSALTYATFLGGSSADYGYGIAVDGTGAAYVTGYTFSGNFPTTPGAFDTSYPGNSYDAFAVKLNPAGSALVYGTFLGGGYHDYGYGIAVDAAGATYVTGPTYGDFPTTPGAFDTSYGASNSSDAFVVKLAMGGAPAPLSGPLSVSPLYPPSSQPSTIMRGGTGHRYFEVRDATGRLAPFVYVTFSPAGSGISDAKGMLDVAFAADDLGGVGSFAISAISASRWGQGFTLASPVSFTVEVQERPFQHHWYGGTIHKAKGGVSAGLVAFLKGEVKGGLGWELEETDASITSDDILRLTEQFQGEVGGGAGIGAKTKGYGVVVKAQAGAELTTEIKALGLGEWQARFDEPYNASAQKAQAVYVLSGLLDMVPEMPDAPALAATLLILTADVDYAAYREREAFGAGLEWTPLHLYEGLEIEFLGAKPVTQLKALDAETTLRLFGTYSEDTARDEWSLALEQEVGFDLDLLTVDTLITQKAGVYVGESSTKLKEELFFDRTTGDPVRFELSLTGEGNESTFTDIPLRSVTLKFIVEGADLDLALERVRNLTALLAAWDALRSEGLIVGSSAALQEVQSYLTSIPLSRYEVTAATTESQEIVPEIGWTGILDIELGAGAEFQQGREILIERGYATALGLVPFVNGLLPTEVYPDRQYGQEAGKTIWNLLDNALAGAYLLIQDLFDQIVQSVQQGAAWLLEIVARTADGGIAGGAQLIGSEGTLIGAAGTTSASPAPDAMVTITASAWAPAGSTGTPVATGTGSARLLSASGEQFAVGGVYQFSPYATTLTPPASLVITYTASALGAADPSQLRLYRWRPEEANWQPLSAEHDAPGRKMTAAIGQLGTYTIGYDAAPPVITMIQPTGVITRTHLPQVSAVITDTGSGIAPASVELRLDGQLVDATYAPLSGQLWYTGTMFLANGTYPYTLTAADTAGNQATYDGSITIAVPAPSVLGTVPPAVPQGVAATVTITGTDFGYPPLVQVDGVTITGVAYGGLSAIQVTLPPDLALGPHSVTVAAPDGQSGSLASAFTVVDPSALTPRAPVLAIDRSWEATELTWQHRTLSSAGYPASVSYYEVWRSTTPYFVPGEGDSSPIAQVIPPSWAVEGELLSYDDDPIDSSEGSRFYRIRSVSVYGYLSDSSNSVGIFSFALVPGPE